MTGVYHLIGGNVGASPSPAMMNAAFETLGIDAVYSPLSVTSEKLAQTFVSMKAGEVSGANITIPHKSAVLPLLDGCDDVAVRIGAVNAIIRDGSDFVGFNTDVDGIVQSLASHGVMKVSSALLIGAGGAARAFCEAASSLGCTSVTVVVRDLARASAFLSDMRSSFPGVTFKALGPADPVGSEAGLVFNASPAGTPGSRMPPNVMGCLKRGMVAFDAVYRPVDTELLSAASRLGCVAIRGHEMLLNQGAAAFERWTGRRAPRVAMRNALLDELGVAQA